MPAPLCMVELNCWFGLLQELENALRNLIGLCQHSLRRLNQNVVLGVSHHLVCNVGVADGGLSILNVLSHDGQVVDGVVQTVLGSTKRTTYVRNDIDRILDEINSRTGKSYDSDVVVKAMLQIRDILMKSERLKTSAKNNTQKDFEFSYFDDIDDALIEGLSQNQDFFSLLLSNEEMKRQVLGIFSEEIYKSLRDA